MTSKFENSTAHTEFACYDSTYEAAISWRSHCSFGIFVLRATYCPSNCPLAHFISDLISSMLHIPGAMAALRQGLADAQPFLEEFPALAVACINSPGAITLAGPPEDIRALVEAYPSVAKQLRVQCAFHTSSMDVIRSALCGMTSCRNLTCSISQAVTWFLNAPEWHVPFVQCYANERGQHDMFHCLLGSKVTCS